MIFKNIEKDLADLESQRNEFSEAANQAKESLANVAEIDYKKYKLQRETLEAAQIQLNEFENEFTRNSSQDDCVPIPLKIVIGGPMSKHKIELDLSFTGTKESTSLRSIAPQIGSLVIAAQREYIQTKLSELQADNVSANRYQEELFAANRRFAADPNNQ